MVAQDPKTGRFIKRHGMWKSREYVIWINMIRRCHTITEKAYARYGARGIKVCDRWRECFENFYEDMGPRPTSKHTLDRIDNDGNYEPSNFRWVTMKVQSNNRSSNTFINFRNERKSIQEWCDQLRLPYSTIVMRLTSGWPVEKALTQPVRKKAPNGMARI